MLAAWAAAAVLAGCGGVSVRIPPRGPSDPVTGEPAAPAAAPVPEPASRRAAPRARDGEEEALESALRLVRAGSANYRIGPADLLDLSVYQEADLSRRVRVGPDGIVTFPLIGPVKVGGLDVAGAEAAITDKLRRFLINPQVSVFIKEYGNKLVYVLGEVKNPGSYPLPTEAPLSVLEAVTLAGGFTPYAAIDRARVIRLVDGRSQNQLVDIAAITKGGDKSKDIPLEPNDVIFIPESFF